MPNNVKIIGIIGGGQLGRMSTIAAANLGIKTHIYTPEKDSPASHVAYKTTIGDYDDLQKLGEFAQSVDIVTFEFENIPVSSVEYLQNNGSIVHPNSNILKIAQNRLYEKDFLNSIDIPTAIYQKITSADVNNESLVSAISSGEFDGKAILKTNQFGYDGKGQIVLDITEINSNNTQENIRKTAQEIWAKMDTEEAVLEGFVPFEKEISVIIARTENEAKIFPPAQNIHKNGILDTSTVPADISDDTYNKARDIAHKIADKLNLIGVLAIEFFVMEDGQLLVNELAPRPHNSGHYTMDFSITSQFEQFIRAVCNLPLGSTSLLCSGYMKNLIGNDINNIQDIISNKNAKLHLYGKDEARAGRKMGHVNYI